MKLGSQIFIKHITDSGLAARNRGLQEGDLILKVSQAYASGGETEAKEGSAIVSAPGVVSNLPAVSFCACAHTHSHS